MLLLGAWLGARLSLTDLGYLDLAHGRQVATTNQRALPPVTQVAERESPVGWLGSLALYGAYRIHGEMGLAILAGLVMAVGTYFLYRIHPGWLGFLVAAAAASTASGELEISASLFSWPLLTGCLFCLESLRKGSWMWALALVPLLGVWPAVNREAAVGMALAVLGLTDAVTQWRVARCLKSVGERARARHRALALISAVAASSAAVILLARGGLGSAPNPLAEASILGGAGIARWTPVGLLENARFFALAVAAGIFVGLRPLAGRLSESAALAGAALCTLASRHFIVLFAAISGSLIAGALIHYLGRAPAWRAWPPRGALGHALAVACAAGLTLPSLVQRPSPHPLEAGARVIMEEELHGPIFNVPEVGGLVRWLTDQAPFSDLRPASLARFQRKGAGDTNPVSPLHDPETRIALLSWEFLRKQVAAGTLASAGFRLIYIDDEALLYIRPASNPEAYSAAVLERFDPLLDPVDYPSEVVTPVSRELFEYLERHPPSARVLSTLGRLLLREGRREEALKALEAASHLRPDDLTILRSLSRLYLEKGMYHLAERSSRQALRLGSDPELIYNLGASLYGQGRFDEALPWLEEVVAAAPESLPPRRALVDLYRRLGKYELSAEHQKYLEAIEESRVRSLLTEARTMKKKLDFSGATRAYRAALEIRPGEVEVLWELVRALLAESRYQEATEAMRDIVKRRPEDGLAHLILGGLCAQKLICPPEEAQAHLEAFVALRPHDINVELARQELERLQKKTR